MQEKAMNSVLVVIGLLLAGIIASGLNLLAPVHEIGHVLGAGMVGEQAEITSWSSTKLLTNHGGVHSAYWYAGYWFEFSVFAILAVSRWGWLRWFASGHLIAGLFKSVGCSDFQNVCEKAVNWSPELESQAETWFYLIWAIITAGVVLWNISKSVKEGKK